MDNLYLLKTFNSKIEAEMAKSVLSASGIQAFIQTDDAGGMYPFPFQPNSSGTKLMVNKKKYNEAIKILEIKK